MARKPFKGIIPSRFHVGGIEYEVEFVTNEYNNSNFGRIEYHTSKIKLQREMSNVPISTNQLTQTFWHEVVHGILDAMGEIEKNNNEQFVCCFSSILNEVIQSCEMDDNEHEKEEKI